MRRRAAVIFQLVAGVFGIYGAGRLIMGHWGRGFAELALGIAIILVLWPMLYVPFVGHNALFQAVPQILIAILLAESLSKDLRREDS